MLSWVLEVRVGGLETALLRRLTLALPWSPFPKLTSGLETGFALLWSMPLSTKWKKEPFFLQDHVKGVTVITVLFKCTCLIFPSHATI